MSKLLHTLTNKDFFEGVSGNDYSGHGGLFKTAIGVSAIRSIGSWNVAASLGLLQAGSTGQYGGSGVVVDTPVVGVRNAESTVASFLYVLGSSGHLYKKDRTGGAPTDLAAGTQIANPANGIAIFQPAGGTKYLYVWRQTIIDRVDITSAPSNYPTGWTQSWQTGLQSTNNHPAHNFLDAVFFGNDFYIGRIQDDGASGVTFSLNVLDFPKQYQVSALEDDGVYLVAALAGDKSSLSSHVSSKIVFWDTFSSSWQREFPVVDTIVSMKRVGNTIYALGGRGIYQVSFSGGVKKIWQKGTTVTNNGASRIIGPGMLSSFNDALVIAGDSGEIAFLGKPDPTLPAAYNTPYIVDGGSQQVSFVDAEFQNGNLVIGDILPEMKVYPVIYTSGQQSTGVSAETSYIPLSTRVQVNRIDLILGRRLASGDSITVALRHDDGTTDVVFGPNGGAATYTFYGAKRRLSLYAITPVTVEDLKLTLTFNAGVVGIRKIEFYGVPISTQTA